MAEQKISFEDGAGYEQMMGKWSQLAGAVFLDWLSPAAGSKWLDVGCGNGAFTQMIVDRCAPIAVEGVDPSEAQLAYARARPASRLATFQSGDGMALPCADKSVDIAVMALVIFFVPDPVKGAAEMVRVLKPGGTACAYVWDIMEGGFPLNDMQAVMREMGMTPVLPPSAPISRMDALRALWTDAGLEAVETTEIRVSRSFADFDDYWKTALLGSSMGPKIASMKDEVRAELRKRVQQRLAADASGAITIHARANAVQGRVPG